MKRSLTCWGEDRFSKIANTEYAFVIDPIDGTHTYSLGMPEFGISVGVLKRGKPYIGVVYASAINEVVYCDGKDVFWLRNAFKANECKTKLEPKEDGGSIIFENAWFVKINDNIDYKKDTPLSFYSAVYHLLFIATGRAA